MPSWKERGLVSHRHNCLGAFVMTHTGKLFVATPSQKWTKSNLAQPRPSRLLGKTQVKTKVATKMESEYELPTLLLTSGLCFSF